MWLPMLLLALMASSSALCPDFCQCNSPTIECHGRAPEIFQVSQLPRHFTELSIQDVNDQNSLRLYTDYERKVPQSRLLLNLKAIKLTNCSLSSNTWIFVATEIEKLNISHNNLIEISGNNVYNEQLRILDAGYNQIQLVTFSNTSHKNLSLTWLSLTNNKIVYLGSDTFKNMPLLEYLDLSDNILNTVDGVFDNLISLQRLNLAGNKFEHVLVKWFRNLSKLVELDLSRNKLTFIYADTLQPLVSLSVFRIAENPLIIRDLSLLLSTGRRLEIVDASRIGLARVPAALTRSVRTLKLAGNQLTSIDSGDLDSYPLLRVLDLSDNRLIIIEDDALGRLDGLEELILAGNILPMVPKSLPSGLNVLDLKQNAISRLTTNDLQGLYLLKKLDLSGNVIDFIEGGSCRQLLALESLDISDNPIKKLTSDMLSGPSNLAVLRMSGLISLETEKDQNQDTAFPVLTPERLIKLDVSRSPALAGQLLADNAALSACKSLQELDLSYTNISAMRSDFIFVLPQLRKLNLIGNKWNCSIDQVWLGEWFKQKKTSLKYSTRCTIPAHLEGKPLEELPFLSDSRVTTTNINIVEGHMNASSTKTPDITSISASKIVNDNKFEKTKSSTSSLKNTEKTSTHAYNATENLLLTTDSNKIMSTISTSNPIITTEANLKIQGIEEIKVTKENTSKVSPLINYELEQTTSIINDEISSTLSTTSNSEKYTPKVINYELTKISTQSPTTIKLVESKQDNEKSLTERNEYSTMTIINNEKSTDISTTTSSHGIEMTTKSLLSSKPIANTNVNTVSATKYQDMDSISEIPLPKVMVPIKFNEPTSIENNLPKVISKYKDVHSESILRDKKKSINRVISELSRSKLLLANEDPRVNNEELSIFAEELNSQATESGARTASESLASGAHPGMLILLGAAIGAAAALTVVLSRRATVKRRDRQYQRHENIEVHALTPTTELW